MYGYVLSDPINFIDPSGKISLPSVGWSDFLRDTRDAVRRLEDTYDNLSDFINHNICRINPDACKKKIPDLDPIPEEDPLEDNVQNKCKI